MDTALFLHTLYRDCNEGFIEARLLHHEAYPRRYWKPLPMRAFRPDRLQADNDAGYNIHFGVGVRGVKSGTDRDVTVIPALFADIDNADPLEHTLTFSEVGPPPSVIISSGGGLHVYWLLDKPYDLRTESVDAYKRTMQGIARAYGGDNVSDLARVMRMPGFYNRKPRYGDNPPGCVVFMHSTDEHGDPLRYSFAELELIYKPFAPRPRPRMTRQIDLSNTDRQLPRWVESWLSTGSGAKSGTRNRDLFAVAVEFAALGYTETECESTAGATAARDSLPESEIRSTIRSAYRYQSQHAIQAGVTPQRLQRMAYADTRMRRDE